MANNVNDVLNVFKSWNGAREGGATHRNILAIYNNHQPLARNYRVTTKDSWCATSVSAAFIQAGAVDALKGGTECSCGRMVELAKRNGLWDGNWRRVPAVGDVVMYDWDKKHGWPEHVGIVTAVNGSSFTVIEGNKNDAVGYRTVSVGSASIAGFIRPAYKAQPQPQPQPQPQHAQPARMSVDEAARKVLNGDFGNGAYRKAKIEALGLNYVEVQARVNALAKGNGGSSSPSYYPRYTGSLNQLDKVLAAIGAPHGSWTIRKPLAEKNGIRNYKGTASQNTQLLTLAKNGKLKR